MCEAQTPENPSLNVSPILDLFLDDRSKFRCLILIRSLFGFVQSGLPCADAAATWLALTQKIHKYRHVHNLQSQISHLVGGDDDQIGMLDQFADGSHLKEMILQVGDPWVSE